MGSLISDPSFWVAVAFFIAIGIVFRPLSRLVLTAIDKRSAEIARNLDEARQLREEAQAFLAKQERQQRDAEKEIQDIINQAHEEVERLKNQASDELAARIELRRQQALDRISQAEADAIRDARHAAVALAVDATRQILADQLDDNDQNRLIKTAIGELGEKMRSQSPS